jgi:hypothetical protein
MEKTKSTAGMSPNGNASQRVVGSRRLGIDPCRYGKAGDPCVEGAPPEAEITRSAERRGRE